MSERPDVKHAKEAIRIAREEDRKRAELLIQLSDGVDSSKARREIRKAFREINPSALERPEFERSVEAVLEEVQNMLIEKNRAYGDSALNPLRVFSRASSEEQLRVRIDDKLSRLARGSDAGEDTIKDLIGYLVLLRVAQKRGKK